MLRDFIATLSKIFRQDEGTRTIAVALPGENDQQYFTHAEAVAMATKEGSGKIEESETLISYLGYMDAMDDFCRVEFRLVPPHGWTQTCRMLRPDERSPDQEITDAHIAHVARGGRKISAIRLYRGKYNVGLAEAKAAVERIPK